MKVLGILQARMSSSRFPGKVLEPIEGMPMIGRQLERLQRVASLDELVVATSSDESDDALADYVESLGFRVFRGSRDDVLARFIQVVEDCNPDVVVRLTGDCPLASPSVIDAVIRQFLASDDDYLSNTLVPTYPDGLDVEVVRPHCLEWVALNSTDSHEREHVTLGVYRRPEMFRVKNFAGSENYSHLRWTVDTPEDLDFVREIYGRLFEMNPEFEYEDILKLVNDEPSLNRTDADSKRNAALAGLDTGAMIQSDGNGS